MPPQDPAQSGGKSHGWVADTIWNAGKKALELGKGALGSSEAMQMAAATRKLGKPQPPIPPVDQWTTRPIDERYAELFDPTGTASSAIGLGKDAAHEFGQGNVGGGATDLAAMLAMGRGATSLLTRGSGPAPLPVRGTSAFTNLGSDARVAATDAARQQLVKTLTTMGASAPEQVKILAIVDRYPQLLAHQTEIKPIGLWDRLTNTNTAGRYEPMDASRGTGRISINPEGPSYGHTLFHELTHGKQGVVLKEKFLPTYIEQQDVHGYAKMPMETSAVNMGDKYFPLNSPETLQFWKDRRPPRTFANTVTRIADPILPALDTPTGHLFTDGLKVAPWIAGGGAASFALADHLAQSQPADQPAPSYAHAISPPPASRNTPAETTPLTADEGQAFRNWTYTNRNAPGIARWQTEPYDMPGFFHDKEALSRWKPGDHFPDTYKQHGHDTFSVESKYSTNSNDGGRWVGDMFIPPVNLHPEVPHDRLTALAEALARQQKKK